MSENAIAQQQDTSIAGLLQSERYGKALSGSVPNRVDAMRLVRVAVSAVKADPKLAQCSQSSFFGALRQCMSMGLEINTVLGHAYLVPFAGKATLIVGYKGLLKLAYRSGMVASVNAHLAREGDNFRVHLGTAERIDHERLVGCEEDVTHAYAVIRLTSGGIVFRVLDMKEILAARPAHWKSTPWNDGNPRVVEEMYLKTALRRALKLVPTDAELQDRAIPVDEAASRMATWSTTIESMEAGEDPKIIEATPIPETPKANPDNFDIGNPPLDEPDEMGASK